MLVWGKFCPSIAVLQQRWVLVVFSDHLFPADASNGKVRIQVASGLGTKKNVFFSFLSFFLAEKEEK